VFAIQRANEFFESNESLDGSVHSSGFLFLYEMFTRSTKCRIPCGSSHTLAIMLLQLYDDCRGGGLMGSILSILANNPDICGDPSIKYNTGSSLLTSGIGTRASARTRQCTAE
jgi:hypothetical protein